VENGETVTLTGTSSTQTLTDQRGEYGFTAIAPGTFRLDVKAPGLVGSQPVAVVSGKSVDLAVELNIEVVKESVTVTAKDLSSRENPLTNGHKQIHSSNRPEQIRPV
jgi:hypothetical protein